MLRQMNIVHVSVIAMAVAAAGCSYEGESAESASTAESAVMSDTVITAGEYSTTETALLTKGDLFMKIATNSNAFDRCVYRAINCPYDSSVPCPTNDQGNTFYYQTEGSESDPFHAWNRAQQHAAWLAAARDTNDTVNVANDETDGAAAFTCQWDSKYGHTRPAAIAFDTSTMNALVYASTAAIPYWPYRNNAAQPWSNVAALQLHEAFHTHAYGDGAGGDMNSIGIPMGAAHVTSNCLGRVLDQSATVCPNFETACGAEQLNLVADFDSTNCQCARSGARAHYAVTRVEHGVLKLVATSVGSSWDTEENVLSKTGTATLGNPMSMARVGSDLHFVSYQSSSTLLHAVRYASTNTWSAWGALGIPSGIFASSISTAAVGSELHVLLAHANSGVWHTMRHGDGNWEPFGNVYGVAGNAPGSASLVCAANVDGALHVAAFGGNNRLYHAVRWANGSWTQWGDVTAQVGALASSPRVIDCVGRGTELLIAVQSGGSLLHMVSRKGNGTWLGWSELRRAMRLDGAVTDFAMSRNGGTVDFLLRFVPANGYPQLRRVRYHGDPAVTFEADGWHTSYKDTGTWNSQDTVPYSAISTTVWPAALMAD